MMLVDVLQAGRATEGARPDMDVGSDSPESDI